MCVCVVLYSGNWPPRESIASIAVALWLAMVTFLLLDLLWSTILGVAYNILLLQFLGVRILSPLVVNLEKDEIIEMELFFWLKIEII